MRMLFRSWRYILLSMVLVTAQFSSVVHSEIHPFHEHSEFCDVFYGVEHQSSDQVADFVQHQTSVPSHFELSTPIPLTISNLVVVYASRAPPVI